MKQQTLIEFAAYQRLPGALQRVSRCRGGARYAGCRADPPCG